jgi:hypothetical protein
LPSRNGTIVFFNQSNAVNGFMRNGGGRKMDLLDVLEVMRAQKNQQDDLLVFGSCL